MSKIPVIAIYGYSNSGKTSLVTELIKDLTEKEYDVCTIKHTPKDISIGPGKKDTSRHIASGSKLTVFSTGTETDFCFPDEIKLGHIVEIIGETGDCDIVLAEGYKGSSIPKIAVGKIDEKENTIARYDGNFEDLVELIEQEIRINRIKQGLPGLDCGLCGFEDCREMAEAIEDGKREASDCRVLEEKGVELRVNGEDVPLERFPANIIKGGLRGMLSTLKGVDGDIKNISIDASF